MPADEGKRTHEEVARACVVELFRRLVFNAACDLCDAGQPDDDGGDKEHDEECPFYGYDHARDVTPLLAWAKGETPMPGAALPAPPDGCDEQGYWTWQGERHPPPRETSGASRDDGFTSEPSSVAVATTSPVRGPEEAGTSSTRSSGGACADCGHLVVGIEGPLCRPCAARSSRAALDDEQLQACVRLFDDVCRWLASWNKGAADELHANRDTFLLPRAHSTQSREGGSGG